jgi:probable F420-dependent oxidoreductase
MKLDAMLGLDPGRAGAVAAQLEKFGYDGLWTPETRNDPFLPLAVAVGSTSRVTLGTAIATAFTRSPMVTALIAWDLQRASGGRFVLGLGTQVKGHNERRFSVTWESPGPKLRELVEALRHIWGAFQGEHALSFRGRFYRHDLMTPFFDPGPIGHPFPPVYLAAVTPYMYGMAGEVADGVHIHPFHTVRYLREVALPALEKGGRRVELTVVAPVFVVVGAADEAVRMQIAFYGSTRTYRPVLELHGWGELTDHLYRLMARGDVAGMAAAIGDDVLAEFAVFGSTWDEALRALRERYKGLLDRVGVYGIDPADAEQIAGAFARASS